MVSVSSRSPAPRLLTLLLHGIADGGQGLAPGARLPQVGDRLRAVGIVERQHGGLVEDVGGAAGWRGGRDCLRPWSAGPDGSPPAARPHCPRKSWRWHRTTACPARCLPADGRRAPDSPEGAGLTEQPLKPARASDAPISVRNCRRLRAVGPDVAACSGNSRCMTSWKASLPASSSRLRQYCLPCAPCRRCPKAASSASRFFRLIIGGTSSNW